MNAVARWWWSHDSGGFDAIVRHNNNILFFVSARFPAVELRWLSHSKECVCLKSVAGAGLVLAGIGSGVITFLPIVLDVERQCNNQRVTRGLCIKDRTDLRMSLAER